MIFSNILGDDDLLSLSGNTRIFKGGGGAKTGRGAKISRIKTLSSTVHTFRLTPGAKAAGARALGRAGRIARSKARGRGGKASAIAPRPSNVKVGTSNLTARGRRIARARST
jgi:hypothetical protein